jgi:hypothetical protein
MHSGYFTPPPLGKLDICGSFHYAIGGSYYIESRDRMIIVTGTYEGGRVLVGSAHLKSRALVSQSASIARCVSSLSVSARHCPSYVPVTLMNK